MKTTLSRKDQIENMSKSDILQSELQPQDIVSEEFIGEKADWSEDISQYRKEQEKNKQKK